MGSPQMPSTEGGGSKALTIICAGGEAHSYSDRWSSPWRAPLLGAGPLSPSREGGSFHQQVGWEGGLAAIWPLWLRGKAGVWGP